MEYHYRRPLPERRSAVAHWLHYTRATADRLSGGGLKPLPVRRSAVAYAYRTLSRPLPERRSVVAFVYFVVTCVFLLNLGKLPASWVVLGSWSIIFLWLLSCKFLWGAD